jgi:hypothetical protein
VPSTSKKQHNFMTAIAHSPSFAKKAGVPQSVGKEFTKADKGHKFAKGGDAMAAKKQFRGMETYKEELGEAKAVASKKITPKQFAKFEKTEGRKSEEKSAFGTGKKLASGKMSPAKYAEMEGKEPMKMARGGGIEAKGKTKGSMVKMARGGGIEVKGKTKGDMVKMTKRFAEGGLTDAEQEAADKAAGLAESNKEAPMGFFERLKAGNIDDPKSEAYKKFGAGRGASMRAAKVPVEDAVPVKVGRAAPDESMRGGAEDERPAPTNMGAIAQLAEKRAARTVPRPAPAARPAAPAASAAPVAPVAPAKSIGGSGRSMGVGGAGVDELEEYAASRRKAAEPVAAAAGSGRSTGIGGATASEMEEYEGVKRKEDMFTAPSQSQIQQAMEVAAQMLGGGASMMAIRALAKKLASRMKKPKQPPAAVPELGMSNRRIGQEPLKLGMKKGGAVKKMATGGSVQKSSSASRRGDGIASKGKTKGRMV